MGKYSALWFCIVPPFGRANTAILELNISPHCPTQNYKLKLSKLARPVHTVASLAVAQANRYRLTKA